MTCLPLRPSSRFSSEGEQHLRPPLAHLHGLMKDPKAEKWWLFHIPEK